MQLGLADKLGCEVAGGVAEFEDNKRVDPGGKPWCRDVQRLLRTCQQRGSEECVWWRLYAGIRAD